MADDLALEIAVSPDKMSASLVGSLPETAPEDVAAKVLEAASVRGLVQVVSAEELADLLRSEAQQGHSRIELRLAQGTAPVPPTEARLEWAGDFFSKEYLVDEATGATDYRTFKSNPSVVKGQLLLTVVPPVEGKDGCDVFGKRVAPPKAHRVRVRAGRNVQVDEAGLVFRAALSGRVRYVGDSLSVDEVYVVTGNVGLETGHIDHPGALEIKGNVEAGSRVKCLGHARVFGYVESADIDVGGDLEVASGITGMGTNLVRVAGSVKTKFIIDAKVEAGQDVWIEREIVHAHVFAKHCVYAREGRLVGGRVHATEGMEVKDAGSEALVTTVLSAGETDEEVALRLEKEGRLTRLRQDSDRICQVLQPVVSRVAQLSEDKRQMVRKLLETEQALMQEIAGLEEELSAVAARPRPRILVRGVLHPETVLRIGQASLRLKESVSGPLVARRIGDRIQVDSA